MQKSKLTQETISKQKQAQVRGVRRNYYDSSLRGLNPAKLQSIIEEAKRGNIVAYLTLAEEMEERDAQYRAVLNTRKQQVSGTPFVIKSVDESKKNQAIYDYIEKVVRDPSFDDLMIDLLDGLNKGFSVVEVIYEYSSSDGKIYPSSYQYKPQQWFMFKDDKLELRVDDRGNSIELEPLKTIVHMPKLKSGMPVRGGLAFAAASIFVYKHFGLRDWAAVLEVCGMPLRVGKFDSGATTIDKESLLQAVTDIGVDYAGIIPKEMEIEFINAGASSNGDLYLKYIEYFDAQLSKIVLGQTMTTDDGSSMSQAKVHNETRELIEIADCKALAATLNKGFIKPLIDYNFGEQDYYPYIEFDNKGEEDRKELMNMAKDAHSIGLEFSASDLRERIGLLPAEEGDSLPRASGYSVEGDNRVLNSELVGVAKGEDIVERDEIEEEVDKNLSNYYGTIEPMINEIEEILNSSENVEDAIKKIEQAELNTERLEKSIFKAIIGQFMSVFRRK